MANKEQFEQTAGGLLIRAPAKVNLSLLVGEKRADGFHTIETVMAKVDYYDELLLQKTEKDGIELTCQGTFWAPDGSDNLVYRAAELLFESAGLTGNVKITLKKNIPAGSGLGSASSDAAATLLGLKRLFKLQTASQTLHTLGAQLGSDVCFFLEGPLAFCQGRGEKIQHLQKKFDFSLLLILPNISVSTKRVYEHYIPSETFFNKQSKEITQLIGKNRIDLLMKMRTNMLETACFEVCPKLCELKKRTESMGVGPVMLSGSGSTLFWLIDEQNRSEVLEYQRKIENEIGCKSIIVSNNRW